MKSSYDISCRFCHVEQTKKNWIPRIKTSNGKGSSIIWSSTIFSHTQLVFLISHAIWQAWNLWGINYFSRIFWMCITLRPTKLTFQQIYFLRWPECLEFGGFWLRRVSHQRRTHLLWCNVLPGKLLDHTWDKNIPSKHPGTPPKVYPPEV